MNIMRYAEKCLQSATRSSSCAAGVPIHLRIFHIRFCSCHQLPCTHEWAPSCATCALCHGDPVPWIRNHMRGFIAKQDNTCLSRNHMPIKSIQTTHVYLCQSIHLEKTCGFTLENCEKLVIPFKSYINLYHVYQLIHPGKLWYQIGRAHV